MSLPVNLETRDYTFYINTVSQYKYLSISEELDLAQRFKDSGDITAAHTLIKSHLRLVVKMAFKMKGYGVSIMDLISEGNIGLMHAVKKYDLSLGVRLSTYAMWWIKAYMQEFILKSLSLVKFTTTIARRKAFLGLKKAKEKILGYNNHSLSMLESEIRLISHELGVSEQDVSEAEIRLSSKDISLDQNIDGQEESASILVMLMDDRMTPEEEVLGRSEQSAHSEILQEALMKLNDRTRAIVTSRYLNDDRTGLKELASQHGISSERVRQISESGFKKIKAYCLGLKEHKYNSKNELDRV